MAMKNARTVIATIGTAIALSIASAHADETSKKWIAFGNSGNSFDVRVGSLKFEEQRRTGHPYATVIVRFRSKDIQGIVLNKYAVALSDCASGYGQLNLHDLKSGDYVGTVEWVNGAGSIASNIADAVCSAAASELADQLRPATRRSSASAL
jgi:hypothetical protein